MKKVYWAPYFEDDRTDWNILYEDPIKLSDKSYSFTNPITTKIQIEDNNISYLSKNYIYSFLPTPKTVRYGLNFMFHCEDNIILDLESNMFDIEFTGKDISTVFDPTTLDFSVKNDIMVFKKDLELVKFNFSEDVELVRFEMTDKLKSFINQPVYGTELFEESKI
jgi:hypothetical protein